MDWTKSTLFIVLLLLTFIREGKSSVHYMCDHEDIQLRDETMTVTLNSQNYPDEVPAQETGTRDCFIYITAAADFKIEVDFVDVVLPDCGARIPDQGSCVYGCDHLYMHEPDAPDQSSHHIFGRRSGKIVTVTRRLYVKFCRHFSTSSQMKFSLRISPIKKLETITIDSAKEIYLSSRYFPEEYNIWNGDDIYYYSIKIQSPHLLPVFLSFTDWHMHPQSKMKILYNDKSLERTAVMQRPFLSVWDSDFTIEFHTGKDPTESYQTPIYPYYLWQANISVKAQSSEDWVKDCGEYFYDVWGGHFKINDATPCQRNGYLDCIFVVAKKQRDNICFEKFILRFDHLGLQHELGDRLEVRSGTTSEGALLWRHFDETNKVFRAEEGYYIHFQGPCRIGGVRLSAVFASTRSVSNGFCGESFKCGNNEMFLPRPLVCDGAEHCYDGTDESQTICTGATTVQLCQPQDLRSCNDLFKDKYCIQQACDGIEQCPGGEDEDNCKATAVSQPVEDGLKYSWGTIIPIALSCLVVAFIMCVLIGLFTRMKRARHRHASPNSQSRPPPVYPGTEHFGDFPSQRDLPPTYDDVAFSLLPPPPYSVNPTSDTSTNTSNTNQSPNDPLSIRPLLQASTDNRLYRDGIPLQPRFIIGNSASNQSVEQTDTPSMLADPASPNGQEVTEGDNGTNFQPRNRSSDLTPQNVQSSGSIKDDSDTIGEVKDDCPVSRQKLTNENVARKKRHDKKTRKKGKGNKQACNNHGSGVNIEGEICEPSDLTFKPEERGLEINTYGGSRETAV